MAAKGALIEFSFAAYTAATPIPLTHYYVEKEYTSIDEGMSEGPKGGITEVARYIEAIGAEHCVMSTDFGRYALSTRWKAYASSLPACWIWASPPMTSTL